ncbi:MAG: acyloxyacyl hydrolase [Muribaculaceae bacterium]|nr:acyloxyacyl hydrolase [Muribaculaceae bacterium]
MRISLLKLNVRKILFFLTLFVSTVPLSIGSNLLPFIETELGEEYAVPSFLDDVLSESLDMAGAVKSRSATSFSLNGGFRFSSDSKEGRRFPGVRQGLGVGIQRYAHPSSIGTPLLVYAFQGAPIWNISPTLALDYEWNFGLSTGWKPCYGTTPSSDLIVGSRMNAYINLGIGMEWHLSRRVSLTGRLILTHFSDGNTSFPNPGVNQFGLRVGVRYDLSHSPASSPLLTPFQGERDSVKHRLPISYDIAGYGAWRRRVYRGGDEPILLKGNYGVAGLSFAPMLDVAPTFRAGLSADFQWDGSSNLRRYQAEDFSLENPCFSRPPFLSQISGGLAARAELVMPIFSVNVGIGWNIFAPEENRRSYQMANLKIAVIRGLFLNIGYMLRDFKTQSNLMLGLGYTFRTTQ